MLTWKHFPRYLPFVWGIHRSPVNSPHKGQWRGALMFSLICVWINGWVNKRGDGDLRRHHTHYDIIVMGSLNATSTSRERRGVWNHRQLFVLRLVSVDYRENIENLRYGPFLTENTVVTAHKELLMRKLYQCHNVNKTMSVIVIIDSRNGTQITDL